MAGDHGGVRLDPALQSVYDLNKNRYKYFKWTPRTARVAFVYAGLIPASLAYVFYKFDGKHNMRAKMRGDVIEEW
ncbi:putative nadh:ubiquinone oxidoreductase subunit [Phaeomoniella chlamydospora]|uniref:Putative nadh:ubiquinone oxidoreductase subunit n=1 Tax=Phaeomoniella chlamydospora TaxID=158046 RepID=A0A0G2F1J2_PHACM|nr:putative nadh:ubiquinone oxidoreductase subunit [Phaeomoniella chlamydospora]